MAYSDIDKSDAFILYSQGHSFNRIAEIMRTRPGCENISPNTLRAWAESPDNKGRSWDDRKAEVNALIDRSDITTAAKLKTDMIGQITDIAADIMDEINSGKLQFKTKDAAVYSLKVLGEWRERLQDKGKRITIENEVQLLLESMSEIPEVQEVIAKHWKTIMATFNLKAKEMLKNKQRES